MKIKVFSQARVKSNDRIRILETVGHVPRISSQEKPPMTRGIVIGHRINVEQGFSMHGAVEIQDLLKWVLYWDQITYAGIGLSGASISGNQPQDISFLEEEGIFNTEIVDLQTLPLKSLPPPKETGTRIFGLASNQFAAAAAAARLHLSNQLTVNTGNIWSVGQSGGEHLLLPGANDSKELIDVQLVNCLPVPVQGTSFQDILEFKNRYQGELEELRRSLDCLRENILSSSDERRAIDAAMHQISAAITNIRAALHGTGIQALNETIALYTQNPSVGFWSALGGTAAAASGYPAEVGVLPGIAGPTLFKFLQRTIIGGRNMPDGNSDFAYVYEAVRQLNL